MEIGQPIKQNPYCAACLQDETEVNLDKCVNENLVKTYKTLVQYEANQLNLNTKNFCTSCAETLLLIHDFTEKCLKSIECLKNQWNPFDTVFIKEERIDEDELLQQNEIINDYYESLSEDDKPLALAKDEEQVEVKPSLDFLKFVKPGKLKKQKIETMTSKRPRGRPRKENKEKSIRIPTKETFYCAHCPKSYHVRTSLRRHIWKKHLGGHECKYCARIFLEKEDYDKHMEEEAVKQHPEPKTRCCEHCGYKTNNSSSLFQHIRKYHSPDEPEKICNECGKSYKLKSELKQHMINVHMEKRFECNECDLKFAERCLLRKHQKLYHSDETLPNGMVKCPYCNDNFKATYFQKHLQGIHLKLKLYKCEICNNAFDTWHQRHNHIKLDHEKFREKCEMCEQTFTRKYALKHHLISIHGKTELGEPRNRKVPGPSRGRKKLENPEDDSGKPKVKKRYGQKIERTCGDCGEIFTKLNDFRQHRIKTHLDEETLKKYSACDMCGDMVLSVRHHVINVHINKKHQFKCDLCDKTFKTPYILTEHRKLYHFQEKKFTCNLCPAKFVKNVNLRQHFEQSHNITYNTVEIRKLLGMKHYERKEV